MSVPHLVRRLIVRGRVQRVGFRAWTEHTALQRGLEGWVRNRRDGSVEVVVAGPPAVVEAMVEACRRGPPGAQVEAVDQREADPSDVAQRRPGEMFSVLASE